MDGYFSIENAKDLPYVAEKYRIFLLNDKGDTAQAHFENRDGGPIIRLKVTPFSTKREINITFERPEAFNSFCFGSGLRFDHFRVYDYRYLFKRNEQNF